VTKPGHITSHVVMMLWTLCNWTG